MSQATPESQNGPEPTPSGTRERIIYRDRDEFNQAMDAAAEAIATAQRPDIVGHVIWWGLLGLLAFLYLSDWMLGWDVRTRLIPGIDLVRPVWVLIAGSVVLYYAWARGFQGRIIKGRLCLACGESLRTVPVDSHGDGTCPRCSRSFNLGEYRAPEENSGRSFQGYLDRDHQDRVMYASAEQIREASGMGYEGTLLNGFSIAVFVGLGVKFVLGWDPLSWVPGPQPTLLLCLLVVVVWGWWYKRRAARLRPSIIAERLCLSCGYSLRHATTEAGIGRCPECGREFDLREYEVPAETSEGSGDETATTIAGTM